MNKKCLLLFCFPLLVLVNSIVGCTTLPEGLSKNPDGSVTDNRTGVVFPPTLNQHDLYLDKFAHAEFMTKTSYSHAGYGGRWTPLISPSVVPVANQFDAKSYLSAVAKAMGIEKIEVASYQVALANKSITVWFSKGAEFKEPNKDAVLFSEKIKRMNYVFVAAGNGFLLQALGICAESEDQYFKWDIKKSFEDYVAANSDKLIDKPEENLKK